MFKKLKEWFKTALPKPRIRDETVQEIGLIAFFCMFGAGLWLVKPALCFIICGLMGMFFFYPRGR